MVPTSGPPKTRCTQSFSFLPFWEAFGSILGAFCFPNYSQNLQKLSPNQHVSLPNTLTIRHRNWFKKPLPNVTFLGCASFQSGQPAHPARTIPNFRLHPLLGPSQNDAEIAKRSPKINRNTPERKQPNKKVGRRYSPPKGAFN